MHWITHVTFPHAPHFFITALGALQNEHRWSHPFLGVSAPDPRYLSTARTSS